MTDVGLAMITVNREFRENFAKTFLQLSRAGIHALEFKTFFGFDAASLRRSMDDYNVFALASHERKHDLRNPELLEKVMEYNRILGTKYIIYTMGTVYSQSEIDELAYDLNTEGKILKENGFELLYHNHAREYEKMANGERIMDYILDRVNPEYANLELDVLYFNGANGIPVKEYIEKRADRIKIIHLKDGYIDRTRTDKQDEMMCAIPTLVGDGIVQIQETVDAAKKAGIDWVMIENEEPGPHAMDDVIEARKRIIENFGLYK